MGGSHEGQNQLLFSDSFLMLLQHENASNPQLQSALMSSVTPEQQLLQNADKKIESLELKLSEYTTIMQATSHDLYNCQKARQEENAACYDASLLAYRAHLECYYAYCTIHEDFENLVTSNLQLQNELAALHDSNQNIKTEKMDQELKGRGSTLQEHTQKKRFSDGDEGLAFEKGKGQVKKFRRTRQLKPKGTDNQSVCCK